MSEICSICRTLFNYNQLEKCSTCECYYCSCCLFTLIQDNIKKELNPKCCYCQKPLEIKFNNGQIMQIKLHNEEINTPHFGNIIIRNGQAYFYDINIENSPYYINSSIFALDCFHFENQEIRNSIVKRNQEYKLNFPEIYDNNKIILSMSTGTINYFIYQRTGEMLIKISIFSYIYLKLDLENNRWVFDRESIDISRRKKCNICNSAVSRTYKHHVENSKEHKKWLEDHQFVQNHIAQEEANNEHNLQ